MERSFIFNVSFNLFQLSKYRTQLMGVAALLIILCHAPQYCVDIQGIPRKLLVFGNVGVDIFLFLSGMGCWFSLTKSPSYFPWLKRRFLRIFIPYTIVLLILRILSLWVNHVPWNEWLLYFSTLRFWTHHDGMWYVALLVLLYPLAPLLFQGVEHSKSRIFTTIILITVLLFITHFPVKDTDGVINTIIINLQWALKRGVNFIVGTYLAPYIKKGVKVNILFVIGLSALGCILFHFLMKDVFYAWLYVLPILIILCMLFEELPQESKPNIFFLWLGAASLESYLTNVGVKALMPLYHGSWINYPSFYSHYLDYLFVIIAGLCLTYITHIISQKVSAKIAK